MVKKTIICVIFSIMPVFFIIPSLEAQYEKHPELISLDIKGMDIKDVLKILSQKTGMNIVADKDVQGTVALYVKDITPMEALDIVVSTNGLAYEQRGTLIRVMNDRKYEQLHGTRFHEKTITKIVKLDYASAADIARALQKIKTRIGKIIPDARSNTIILIDNADIVAKMVDTISEIDTPLTTEVFSLNYAEAKGIRDELENMISDVGSIRFDERTNKIVVKDTPKKIDDIKKVIKAFDEKTREVVIDANIIQVTLSDKYSYGIDWADIAQMADVRLTGQTNLSTGLTGVTPSTLTIATTGGNYSTVISLLKTFGETNVLSRPRITVADKEKAKILVGSKEVYVSSEVTTTVGGTYHTTDHVQFVDVGVALSVTPIINKAGFITMKIKPEVSSTDATRTIELKNPDGSTRTIVPYVTTSEAETTVLAKDNTTIIIGGLMKDTMVEHKEKVPFLGDIPFLGKLFSTTGKSKEKTELVIFLTPHIIEGDRVTKEAKSYIADWKRKEDMARIKKPEEPKFEWPKLKKERHVKQRQKRIGPIKTERISKFKTEEKKPGWTPLFGAKMGEKVRRPAAVVKKTPYEQYYLTLRDEINSFARRQDVSGHKGVVELKFTLDREGFIVRGPVVLNKADLKLVRAAVNCVKMSSPFPPFPKEMKKKEEEFYVVVRYK